MLKNVKSAGENKLKSGAKLNTITCASPADTKDRRSVMSGKVSPVENAKFTEMLSRAEPFDPMHIIMGLFTKGVVLPQKKRSFFDRFLDLFAPEDIQEPLHLRTAMVCVNCERIFKVNGHQCPSCTDTSIVPLSIWLPTMNSKTGALSFGTKKERRLTLKEKQLLRGGD